MNKRSAVLMAAGLVGSLVMGVLAFALGALGPVASAAGPKLSGHRQRPAHATHRQASNPGAASTGAVSGTTFVPAATTSPGGSNHDGTEGGSEPSEEPSPEPSDDPSPEPSESPEPSPTGEPGSEDPSPAPAPSPSPSPGGEPGDDEPGDD